MESLAGDALRIHGATLKLPCRDDYNPAFQNENMYKRSIVLDLKKPEGKRSLIELVQHADIFMSNVRGRILSFHPA